MFAALAWANAPFARRGDGAPAGLGGGGMAGGNGFDGGEAVGAALAVAGGACLGCTALAVAGGGCLGCTGLGGGAFAAAELGGVGLEGACLVSGGTGRPGGIALGPGVSASGFANSPVFSSLNALLLANEADECNADDAVRRW